MFDHNVDYPTAVASYDEEGVAAAIEWSAAHLQDGDMLSVWTALRSNLRNCGQLEQFVQRYRDVVHITGRGGGTPAGAGPVLMAWADVDDIGEMVRFSRGIRGLCVIAWNADGIRPWVTAMKPEILGDDSDWKTLSPEPDPIVVEALKSLTLTVNHSNTISAGFEKDQVVSVLLALHDARIPMEADSMQGWALAHGWSGKNPARLAQYVRDINSGKRPRSQRILNPHFVDRLRERATSDGSDSKVN